MTTAMEMARHDGARWPAARHRPRECDASSSGETAPSINCSSRFKANCFAVWVYVTVDVVRLGRPMVGGAFRFVRPCAFAAVCVVVSSSPLFAQVAAGELTGMVKDPAGAAVPGATVTVTDIDRNVQRVVVSSADGVYRAASLAPGLYRIE